MHLSQIAVRLGKVRPQSAEVSEQCDLCLLRGLGQLSFFAETRSPSKGGERGRASTVALAAVQAISAELHISGWEGHSDGAQQAVAVGMPHGKHAVCDGLRVSTGDLHPRRPGLGPRVVRSGELLGESACEEHLSLPGVPMLWGSSGESGCQLTSQPLSRACRAISDCARSETRASPFEYVVFPPNRPAALHVSQMCQMQHEWAQVVVRD